MMKKNPIARIKYMNDLVTVHKSLISYELPVELEKLTELSKWIDNESAKTHPVASLVTTIAIASALSAGKTSADTDAPTSLYLVLILPTGGGKDAVFRIAEKLIANCIQFGNLTSLGSLEDMLVESSNIMHFNDEFGDVIGAMLSDKNGSLKSIMAAQKILYSSSRRQYKTTRYSTQGGQKNLNHRVIEKPCYGITGLSTEMQLFSKIGKDMIYDGFLNRFIFINGTGIQPNFNDTCIADPSNEILDHIKSLSNYQGIRVKIKMTDSAKNYYDNIIGDADLPGTDINRWVQNEEMRREISVRWRENSIRLATALAAYEKFETLPLWLLEWSYGFVKFNSISFLETFENRKNSSTFTETLDAVLKWFKSHDGEWISLTAIANKATRLSAMTSKERNMILSELVEREHLEIRSNGNTTEYSFRPAYSTQTVLKYAVKKSA